MAMHALLDLAFQRLYLGIIGMPLRWSCNAVVTAAACVVCMSNSAPPVLRVLQLLLSLFVLVPPTAYPSPELAGTTAQGVQECLIYRDPGIHPGDVRRVRCAQMDAACSVVQEQFQHQVMIYLAPVATLSVASFKALTSPGLLLVLVSGSIWREAGMLVCTEQQCNEPGPPGVLQACCLPSRPLKPNKCAVLCAG